MNWRTEPLRSLLPMVGGFLLLLFAAATSVFLSAERRDATFWVRQPLEPRVIDVNKLAGGMSELLQRSIGEAIHIETVLAGGLWKVLVDPAQLESAIVNLAVNARDAMPDGGKLTIETQNAELDERYAAAHNEVAAGQYVVISVTDSGAGISREVLERAFDPFYTTKGPGQGTGLGLSQVFGFVKQSSGHIKLYSEVGHGTTVKIYLPRHRGESPVAA
jgi:signal transduction histidine kinase